MDVRESTETRKALARELRYIGQALVAGSAPDAAGWGNPGRYERLAAIVKNLRSEEYALSPRAALVYVLATAIQLLGTEKVPGYTIQYRWAAERLFGLVDADVAHIDGKRYDNILGHLAATAGVQHSDRAARLKFASNIRRRVAHKLIELNSTRDGGAEAGPQDAGPEFKIRPTKRILIPRPRVEAKISKEIALGTSPIILWGEAGTGKTTLAETAVSKHFIGRNVALIRGPEKGPFFKGDIIRALVAAGLSPESWSFESCAAALEDVLERGALDAILFDDVSRKTVERYLSKATVPTIVTSRKRLPTSGRCIRIRSLTDGEAFQMAEILIPGAPKADLRLLCNLFGNRPSALVLASRLLQLDLIELPTLITACKENLPEVFSAAVSLLDEPIESSLVYVYEQLLETTRADPTCDLLIDTMLWITGSADVLSIVGFSLDAPPASAQLVTVQAALVKLESFGLIYLKDDVAVIDVMTLEVLRSLSTSRTSGTLERFFNNCCLIGATHAIDMSSDRLFDALFREAVTKGQDQSRYGMVRYLTNLAAGCVTALLKRLAPAAAVGAVCVGERTWIIWQNSGEWWLPAGEGRKLAVVTADASALKIWSDGAVSMVTRAQALTLYAIADLYPSAVDGMMNDFLPDEYVLRLEAPQIWPSTQPEIHRPILAMPESTLARLGTNVWAFCGARCALITPSLVTNSTLERCQDCRAMPGPIQNRDRWISALRSMASLIDFGAGSATSAEQFAIYMTLASLETSAENALTLLEIAFQKLDSRLDDTSLTSKLVILAEIHNRLVFLGRKDAALTKNSEIRSILESARGVLSPHERSWLWCKLSEAWARAGDLAEELSAVRLAIAELNEEAAHQDTRNALLQLEDLLSSNLRNLS